MVTKRRNSASSGTNSSAPSRDFASPQHRRQHQPGRHRAGDSSIFSPPQQTDKRPSFGTFSGEVSGRRGPGPASPPCTRTDCPLWRGYAGAERQMWRWLRALRRRSQRPLRDYPSTGRSSLGSRHDRPAREALVVLQHTSSPSAVARVRGIRRRRSCSPRPCRQRERSANRGTSSDFISSSRTAM